MKKRALSLLMAAALFVSVCSVSVQAEFEITTSESQGFEVTEEGVQSVEQETEQFVVVSDLAEDSGNAGDDYNWYSVKVQSEGFVQQEIFMYMDGIWYMSTDQIEYYTDYIYTKEDKSFREDGEKKKKGWAKGIRIEKAENYADVRGYVQKFENIYEFNEQYYYPIHQILPLMECVCAVEDGVLHIEKADISMMDAMKDYKPDSLYFDAAAEFDGKAWANTIMVGSAYLFDTVANPDNWDRFLGTAKYKDYQTAAKDYLTDYEIYEEVMEYKNTSTDTAKQLKKNKGKEEAVSKGFDIISLCKDLYKDDFYKFIPEDVFKEMEGWNTAADISAYAIDAVVNYTLMVKDHREMLAAVYPEVEGSKASSSQKIEGVNKVYEAYGKDALYSILTETAEGLYREGFWKLTDIITSGTVGMYKTVATLGGAGMTKIVEALGVKDSDGMALLNHHIVFTNEAKEKYARLYQSGAYTQERIEDLRLSAIMTMISSKKCFEIIRDNNARNKEVQSYCNNQIGQIEEALKKLYLAKEAVMVDGIEYFQKATELFEAEFANISGEESAPPNPLSDLEKYFRENYSKSDSMWLLDVAGNDGINELLVVTAPNAEKKTYFRVYGTYDGEISLIFEEWAGAIPGERKAMYLMEDGYGNYAFLYYYPQTLQGYNDTIEVFALQTWGGWILLRSESVKGEQRGKEVLAEVVEQFHYLNPYWIELFNTLIGSEDEGMQNALNGAGVELGLANHSNMESLSVEEKLEKYYLAYFSDIDRKWIVDLTGDGQPELLAISGDGELIECNVYAVKGNSVARIFGDAAAESHAGQKALYLVDNMDGSFSLLSYMPSNWQGYRSISADWYTINNDGEWISRDYLYTDSDYDMYEDVRQFLWRMYPYSVNMEVLYDTIPEEEKDEWTSALASLSQDEVLSGTPDEDSELNQTSNSDAEDDWTLSEDWESESQDSGTEQLNNSSVEFVFQMPENIFWSIDDPYGSWQLRFRNEDDGCYMDLRSPDGMTFSSPCELDMGTSVDIDIDDYKLLEMNVMSFSQDFTGGDYNITYSPETSQIFVTTANGQWIELYFFDD